MKTVVFGGTFNPPHKGHERMAKIVYDRLKPDRFLVIPNFLPPHKEMADGSPTPAQRLEMCRIAFRSLPYVEISDMELQRKGSSYTVDTLTLLREQFHHDEFYFILGSDSLLQFEKWRRFMEIFSLCTLVVLQREYDYEELKAASEKYRKKYDAKIILLPDDPLVISSTNIREGEFDQSLVSEKVLEYIKENHLYGK